MADWSRLTTHLEGYGTPRVVLSFSELERIIGDRLPASSRYPAFWSNSSTYAKSWKRAGYETTRRGVLDRHMGFVRTRPPEAPAATAAVQPSPRRAEPRGAADIILVGCVKTKAKNALPARDLYLSPMFERRRRYAEASGKPWYILSAEHGMLDPATIIEPYDVYLANQTDDYRQAWGEWVAAKLARLRGSLRGQQIEVHASAAYIEAIELPLRRRGAAVISPLAGLRQGEQLAWYDQSVESDSLMGTSQTDQSIGSLLHDQDVVAPVENLVIVDGPHRTGSFTFQWPDSTVEHFDQGWDLVVDVDGQRRRVRHGIGNRQVYGMPRRHSVTFVDELVVR